MARGSFARRLVVAGTVVWVARWAVAQGETKPAPIEVPDDVPEAAVAPAARRHTFRRRFATSLAFSALFFAGAAFTAGAGNQLARVDDSSTAAPTVVDTTTIAAPVDTVPVATPVDAAPVDTAPVDTAPVEAAPVDAAPAATDPAATDPATTDPATTDPAPASDPTEAVTLRSSILVVAEATVAAASASTYAAVPAVQSSRRTGSTTQAHRAVAAQVKPVPVVLAPIPFEAISFNPHAWLHANPASPTGASAVAIALHYLGVPYRWGGAIPASGFDCSGLTRFVYAQLGINLPHYAAYQFADFAKLDPSDLRPGDLVFFEPKFDGPGHVALYIGNDQMIEAPHTGALVRISSFSGAAAQMGFLGAVRPYTGVAGVTPVPSLSTFFFLLNPLTS
jgi:peptidoglycan DL-endopeptidase CwlO